jgi:hypothetical protein
MGEGAIDKKEEGASQFGAKLAKILLAKVIPKSFKSNTEPSEFVQKNQQDNEKNLPCIT